MLGSYPCLGRDATTSPTNDHAMSTETRKAQYRAYKARRRARLLADPKALEQERARQRARHQRRLEAARKDPAKRQKLNARARISYRVNKHHTWPRPEFFLCSDCDNKALEYHHESYELWWSVEPLCKRCHAKRHHVT